MVVIATGGKAGTSQIQSAASNVPSYKDACRCSQMSKKFRGN